VLIATQGSESKNAVVILRSVKIGNGHKNVERFLTRIEDKCKVIVCTTCSGEDIVPKKYGIDSVNAASKEHDIEKPAKDIKARLRAVLGF
jgi:hypothetical protein